MCVIFMATKVRPTEEMVERAWNHNKDGGGIAWRENGEVHFEKGIMELADMKKMIAAAKLPHVAHFRVASVGGVKPELTHPFIVSAETELYMKGTTKSGVLFHNGHWSQWNELLNLAIVRSGLQTPEGPEWSDSRAMAFLTYLHGPHFVDALSGQKGVLVTPKKFQLYIGPGWEKVNDVWCSNDYFWVGKRHQQNYSTMCVRPQCVKQRQAGKNLCVDCEKKDEVAQKAETKPVTSTAIVLGGTKGPFARVFTLAEVEQMHKRNGISKSALKKYRKASDRRTLQGAKGDRAWKQMQELSERFAEKLMLRLPEAGSKH